MNSDKRTQTVQDFINSGDTYFWYCRDTTCKAESDDHMEPIDMLRFRDKFGPDHGSLAPDILPLMHCTRCKGRNLGLIRQPKGTEDRRPKDPPAVNPYLKAKGG